MAERDANTSQARLAVITGGASGPGLAAAHALRTSGFELALLDTRASLLHHAAHALHAEAVVVDITDAEAVQRTFNAFAEQNRSVSVLLNCAGTRVANPVLQHGKASPLEAFGRIVEHDLIGALNCIRCAVPQMIEAPDSPAGAGVIINALSIAALDGPVGHVAHAAAQGGVAGMVLPLARELGEFNIRVMGIATSEQEDTQPFTRLVLHILANPLLNGEVIRLDGALRIPATY